MAIDTLVENNGMGDVSENLARGVSSGLVNTANLAAYTIGAGLLGYLVGDQLPEVLNYLRTAVGVPETLGTLSLQVPRGFGVPDALAVPEQLIFGHAYARELSMGYLAAAPVVTKYVGEHIIAPLVKPLVDVVRRS